MFLPVCSLRCCNKCSLLRNGFSQISQLNPFTSENRCLTASLCGLGVTTGDVAAEVISEPVETEEIVGRTTVWLHTSLGPVRIFPQ